LKKYCFRTFDRSEVLPATLDRKTAT